MNQISVSVSGDRIRAFLNGQLLFDVEDDAIQLGGAGLYSWANAGVEFDDFRVTPVPPDPFGICEEPVEELRWPEAWQVFTGTSDELLALLGGWDAVEEMVPAPDPLYPHLGFAGVPPVGYTSWDDIRFRALDEAHERAFDTPYDIATDDLTGRVRQCGGTIFELEDLPEHPDVIVSDFAVIFGVERWFMIQESAEVFALVDVGQAQARWLTVTWLHSEIDGDSLRFSRPFPLTDPGFFLNNLSCE